MIELGDARIGLTICEDMWVPGHARVRGGAGGRDADPEPVRRRRTTRARAAERERMLVQRARDNLAAVAFANLVGGQDELVFDGHSLLIDHEGCVLARAPQFEEALVVADRRPRRRR